MLSEKEIYLSTVLLEKNRWGSREPSIKLSDWLDKINDAGFDGLELWENHILKSETSELQALQESGLPVKVLNTYCDFDDESADKRKLSAELANKVNAKGVKFNFGNKKELEKVYIENMIKWQELLPDGCKLLCECHPYTVLEELDEAIRIMNSVSEHVEIIVHAFGGSEEDFDKRLSGFASTVSHIHVAGGGVEGYRYSPLNLGDRVPTRIEKLNEYGFKGTWTIEFCDGVASKDENIDDIFSAAKADLNTLRGLIV
jgi:sugar phosphate isomerase/epimerase